MPALAALLVGCCGTGRRAFARISRRPWPRSPRRRSRRRRSRADPLPGLRRARRPRPGHARRRAGAAVPATELETLGYQARRREGQLGAARRHRRHQGQTARQPGLSPARAASVDLKLSDDYIAGSGVQTPTAAINDAELVFVGYGIEAPEYQWDDFKGVDVKGKVLVMLNNDPDWDPKLFAGKTRLYYGRWTYKYESARAPWRGGRHHHPHHAVGGLSLAGGAVVLGRRAVRAARRRRAAHPAQGLGHGRCRAPPGEGRRGRISTSWSRRREEPQLQAGAAGPARPRSGSRTRSRACAPRTSPGCCRAAIRSSRTKW